LIRTLKKFLPRNPFSSQAREGGVVEAYNLWAENYDSQPGNLMLDLDAIIFSKLLDGLRLKDKQAADIGCGTGRHWPRILAENPAALTGFDVSPGMLSKLRIKYPKADTAVITNNRFHAIADQSYDVILSTLTVAHIRDIEEALRAWCRILRDGGDIIITDFHPDALAMGGKRTFSHKNGTRTVQNFVHPVEMIKDILLGNGFDVAAEQERRVDDSVRHYYQEQNALHVYEKFKDCPIIYGLHFKKQ